MDGITEETRVYNLYKWLQELENQEETYWWFDNLKEPWMRTLVMDYIYHYRYQRIVTPYGATGQMTEESDTKIPCQEVKTLGKQDSDNGASFERTSINDKPHDLNSKKEDQKITKKKKRKTKRKENDTTEKKHCETVHVWGVNPQWKGNNNANKKDDNPKQRSVSRIKSARDTSAAVVSFECCPNKRAIQNLSPPLGELFRIGALAGTTWTSKDPITSCHFVLPNGFYPQIRPLQGIDNFTSVHKVPKDSKSYESHANCKNSLMVIEKIKNKSNARRIATLTQCDLLKEEIGFTDYIESVKEFGFNHIIIIGERDYGMLFFDCYGRIFDWDAMSFVLWPIGEYSEIIAGKSNTSQMVWGVEFDGTISEFEYEG
ncbi:hypothetical protein C1645_813274 [Glomus cerebriforme]|uniref:Uncharacterized protein n=1 Tax=Glomus cerebriforme TaxID=658196 RepID=A0A397TKY7_9GLOM|nr:hypothetical protein C1645_813274 [Glomus cerebriforme]